jgi:hypothetical protein
MDREDFYDNYEASETVANLTDQVCLSCPVMQECLRAGLDNSEWGVWGGIYLTSGKYEPNRNSHKSKEVWEKVRGRVGEAL